MTPNDAAVPHPRPHVVIIGAGFGGLSAAHHLADLPVEVTMINRDNYHGFWPLLYQVATAGLGPDDIARPVRAVLAGHRNVRFRLGTVTGIDFGRRHVQVEGEEDVAYDYLIVATGSSDNDFGIPGMRDYAFPLKSVPDAVRLRNHILATFEYADAEPQAVDEGALTIVLIGGGSTGVEMAGALSELIGTNLAADFPNLDTSAARVVLVEMGGSLIATFSAPSQAEALRTLRAKGVEIRLDTKVSEVGDGKVAFADGSTLAAHTVVWTAGVKANALADSFATEKGKGGTVGVGPDLAVPDHPEVFCIGDVAAATGTDGEQLPQVAQVAIQGGRHAARTIARRLRGKPGRPLPLPRPRDDGDHRPALGGGRAARRVPFRRDARLAAVAGRPPGVPRRLPQPHRGPGQLGVELRHVGPGQPGHPRHGDHGRAVKLH